MPEKSLKKIALAFPGCSGRAIACIGMLEVFDECGIPISMISACSSTSFVACAYAAGTLPLLKEKYMSMGKKELFDMLGYSFKSGIFSLDKLDNVLREIIPYDNLEDLNIPVSLAASDLVSGKEVSLTMGNIARAIKASCAYPGLFEPVMWGGKVLVDGGLFSITPIDEAKDMDPDYVIGISMHNEPYLFVKQFLRIKNFFNFFKKIFGLRSSIFRFQEGYIETDDMNIPSFMNVLNASLDYAIKERKKEEKFDCDLVIDFDSRGFKTIDLNQSEKIYQQGRIVAKKAVPEILKLLNGNLNPEKNQKTNRLSVDKEHINYELSKIAAENKIGN
jgi:NTE family protein